MLLDIHTLHLVQHGMVQLEVLLDILEDIWVKDRKLLFIIFLFFYKKKNKNEL